MIRKKLFICSLFCMLFLCNTICSMNKKAQRLFPRKIKKTKKVKQMPTAICLFNKFYKQFQNLINGLKNDEYQDYLYIYIVNCDSLLNEIITYFDYSFFIERDLKNIKGLARRNYIIESFKKAFRAIKLVLQSSLKPIRYGCYPLAKNNITQSYFRIAAPVRSLFKTHKKSLSLKKKEDIQVIIDLVRGFEKLTKKKIQPRRCKKEKA